MKVDSVTWMKGNATLFFPRLNITFKFQLFLVLLVKFAEAFSSELFCAYITNISEF